MARNTLPTASPAVDRPAAPEGIPAAPPVGGARTFAEMEDLARRHAAEEAAKSAPVPPAPPPAADAAMETPAETAPEQEVSTDE